MTRVRRGTKLRRRHKKIIAQTKGHHGLRHRIFRRAAESRVHALAYAYRDRRDRKADFRRLWIQPTTAPARRPRPASSVLLKRVEKTGSETAP